MQAVELDRRAHAAGGGMPGAARRQPDDDSLLAHLVEQRAVGTAYALIRAPPVMTELPSRVKTKLLASGSTSRVTTLS